MDLIRNILATIGAITIIVLFGSWIGGAAQWLLNILASWGIG